MMIFNIILNVVSGIVHKFSSGLPVSMAAAEVGRLRSLLLHRAPLFTHRGLINAQDFKFIG